MFDPAAGWAIAGEEGVEDHILRTDDGGATWRDVTPPEPQARAQQPLKSAAVYFLDADTAWATYYPYDLTEASIIWRTDDGGKSWEPSNALDWRDLDLFKFFDPGFFHFADNQYGWLMVDIAGGMGKQLIALYRTTNGGESWERIYDSESSNLLGELDTCCKTGMDFSNAETGLVTLSPWGIDAAALARTRDGGLTWQMQYLPEPNQVSVSGATCFRVFSPKMFSPRIAVMGVECWFTEPDRTETFLYVTEDSGQTWRINPFPGGSLQFVSADVGWALDRSLHITLDGGLTWTKVKSVGWDGQFSFISDQLGWAVASTKTEIALVRTTDGSRTWEQLDPKIGP